MKKTIAAFIVAATFSTSAHAETLKVWTIPWSDAAMAAFKSMAEDFHASHPNITIDVESRGVDEHKTAMRIAVNSGTGPDIYYMWGGLGLGGEFVKAGASLPLGQYYKQYKWDDRFVPAALIDSRRYNGQRHGVPFLIHGQGFYYNEALFKQAGITTPPTNYSELVADAKKLKTAGIPAIIFGGSVNWHLMRMMDVLLETECGATTHDALTNMKANWATTACATNAFTQLQLWTSQYTLHPFMGLADDQAQALFYAGRAAMILEGDWFVSMLRQSGTSGIGLFLPPTGTGRLYSFSEYFYVYSKSKHQADDAKFLDFITSPSEQQKYLGKFGSVSVDRSIDYSKLSDPLDKQWQGIITHASGTYANGDQAFPLDVTTEYWRVINLVTEGQMAPAAAAADMQTFISHRHS